MKDDWLRRGNHVWYFADQDKLAILDDFQHWYWSFCCIHVPHAIYLGEL